MISKSLGININPEFNLRLPHSECRLIVCSAAFLEGEYGHATILLSSVRSWSGYSRLHWLQRRRSLRCAFQSRAACGSRDDALCLCKPCRRVSTMDGKSRGRQTTNCYDRDIPSRFCAGDVQSLRGQRRPNVAHATRRDADALRTASLLWVTE